MYLRWKAGPLWLRVSLVRSVRKHGQPRQEILGSFSVRQDVEGKAALAWNMLEDHLASMTLVGGEYEKLCQAFARRIPRPSDEELQERRVLSERHRAQQQAVYHHLCGDDWQRHLAAVVPNVPPRLSDEPLHEPCLIAWKVEQPRPKFHQPAVYTAFLARGVMAAGKQLKLGEIAVPALAGTITTVEGKEVVPYQWRDFWYSTHHALVLAGIAVEVYHQVMHQLAHWVKRPTHKDIVNIVEDRLYWERSAINTKLRELDRAMQRTVSKSEAQRTVLSRSSEYLSETLHPHWVR